MNEINNINKFPIKNFIITSLIVSIWINISEVIRYFGFVMPMTREELSTVPGVAPMSIPVFAVWGVWDTILVIMVVFFYWLYTQSFDISIKSALISGTLSWVFFFVLFWMGLMNMGLASFELAALALSWAWLELVIASLIAWYFLHFRTAA